MIQIKSKKFLRRVQFDWGGGLLKYNEALHRLTNVNPNIHT